MKKSRKILFSILVCAAFLSGPQIVLAATTLENTGVNQVDANINLSNSNPFEVATRIINLSLTFLSILAVCIVLYGGFIWMKSNGSETEIEKAKKILKAGAIGLVIILSAWGIAYFVLSRFTGTGTGNGNTTNDPNVNCVSGTSCLCNGHKVCDNNGGYSCVGSDCSHSTSTPISCNGSLTLGTCQPEDNLCGLEDKICNTNCLCEDKSQDGDSCGLKTDGSCDVNGNNCAAGLTCNASSCTCEGPMLISGVSPVGGYCENDKDKVCESTSDCPGSTCNTTTPNGKAGNLLTIYGKNFNKTSGNQTIFTENFESYSVNQTPTGAVFSNLEVGSSAKVLIAKTSNPISSALLFKQYPGNVDGLNSGAAVTYTLGGTRSFTNGNLYGIQFNYKGESTNRLEIYFNDGKIAEIAPGQYTNQRSMFLSLASLSSSNSQKFKFVLVDGPTGNGTSLYIDNFSLVNITANQQVTIGGVVATSAAAVYPQCTNTTANQLIVVVPEGVQNGDISITRNGEGDSTKDDNGPKVPDFIKNTIARPGLCSLSPNAAQTNDELTFAGNNLKSSSVFFGSYQENIGGTKNLADNNSGSSAVPSVYVGGNSLFVGNGKLKSNFLYFTKLNDLPPAPSITSISPNSGPAGQYVTITGSNFGDVRGNGKVFFGDKEANYQFPEECTYSLWSDKQILVKVPEGVTPIISAVKVITDSWTIDSSKSGLNFTYNATDQIAPGICKINPSRGPIDSKTTLFGENFGNNGALAKIYFNSILATSTISASKKVDKVEVTIPTGAVTGAVRLENSNSVNFQVGSCEKDADCLLGVCCSAATTKKGQCADNALACVEDVESSVFEWAFSTNFGTTTIISPGNSCLGISKEIGSCQTNEACPNVPGKCSSGSSIITVDKGACCPDGYKISEGVCVKNVEPQPLWSDKDKAGSFCKTLSDYRNKNRLVYSSTASCDAGWLKINNNLCAKGNSIDKLKEENNCSLCANGEQFVNGRCIINYQCKGNETCNSSGRCTVDEAPSCECCCQIGNGNQDCCAPLTCGGTCGSDTNANDGAGFGKCSGCYSAGTDTPSRDAACNCSGHNGQFCAKLDSFPSGACVDCATLDEAGCQEHSNVCCLDAKNTVGGKAVCRGGAGNLVSGGFCAYFDCSTTGDKKCASSTPVATGNYSSVTDCEAGCSKSGETGLGLDCGSKGVATSSYTCDPSICGGVFSTSTSVFSCINSTGGKITSTSPSSNGECGVCCCSPGDNASCQAINPKLSCSANKGDCSGASRGLCCGCSSDSECGSDSTGCGADSCCYPKPKITDVSPAAGTNNICRNSAVRINFDRLMTADSIDDDNIKLLEEHPAGFTCPTSTPLAVDSLKENILAKTFHYVEKVIASIVSVFNKDRALADNTANHTYCQVPVDLEAVDVTKNSVITTSVVVSPKNVLAKNTNYLVFVKGNNQTKSPADGVLSVDGVGMNATVAISLTGGEKNLLMSFVDLEDQVEKLRVKVASIEKGVNPKDVISINRADEIIDINKSFDKVEQDRNSVGLEIAKALGDIDVVNKLNDKITKLEQKKIEVAKNRELVYRQGKKDLVDELNKTEEERDKMATSIETDAKNYVVQLQNGGASQADGGTKINGKSYKAFTSAFTTKGDICQIDYTTLAPSQYLFSTTVNDSSDDVYGSAVFDTKNDRDKVLLASAYSSDDQLLNPVAGYSWTWEFKSADTSLVSTVATSTNRVIATASDKVSDGKTLLYATVKMPTNNQYFGGNGKKSSAELFIFICANPWPRVSPTGTWAPWRDNNPLSSNPFQYDFYYCRDAGQPTKDDDLPEVGEAKIAGQSGICRNDSTKVCENNFDCPNNAICVPNVLKEYYFFSKN